jgi:branched-chain amino acid transport system substrate-binding protein
VISACSSTNGQPAPSGSATEAGGTTATGTPFKIGYICLCSFSTVGKSTTLGAFTAWMNWTNAHGGINGHPVQLITRNDPGNPGVALSEVKQLVAQGIVALAENDADDGAAWASYIQSAGVPVFDTTSSTLTLAMSPDAFSPLVSLVYNPAQIVATAKKAGSSKMAILYCAELANCKQSVPAISAAAGKVGIKVPFSTSMLSTAPNFTAQCLAAKSADADSMFIAAISVQAELRVMANCVQQGYTPHLISASGDYGQSFAGAPGTNGMVAGESTIPFFDTSNPQIQTMTAAFNQYEPGLTTSPNYSDVPVWQWAAGTLIATAAKAGGVGTTKPLTAAALLNGIYTMHSTDLGGLTPTLTFVKGGPHFNKCWFYAALQNGKFATPYGLTPTCAP